MDSRTLQVLEYPKVRDILVRKTNSPVSREIAENLEPVFDFDEVQTRLVETAEARSILRTQLSVPLGGIREIRPALRRAEIGAILDPVELLDIANTLYAIRRLKKFVMELEGPYPILKELGTELQAFPAVENPILSAIRDQGDIADEASIELMRIRRERRAMQQRVRERLESILRSADYGKMIQEAIVTLRDDRYVIPIKQEFRGQFPGIIHDQSSSGATLFIEPLSVLELNNELKQLASAEQTEIQRVLAMLSGMVAREVTAIGVSLGVQGQIDFVFAKAKLADDMRAEQPKLNQTGFIRIKQGRHPLIQGEVVPTDIHLGKDFTTLVMTGPNTGGKTVTLKTVGLFVLMTQAGLHVPAGYGTEIGIFRQVFADIGDEQSIEQSLSTFSAHMTNLVRILAAVDQQTLVLTDELGAGTDPTEGAALAMSILEYTHSRGARTIATTHYSELKTFAYSRTGVENASVEFDVKTLRPTYRLLIGMPGRSNAFEIAGRLGLSSGIIGRARELITEEQLQLEDLLNKLAESRSHWEQDQRVAAELRKESEQVKAAYEKQRQDMEQREKEILQKARQQALDIVAKAKRDAEEIIGQLKTVSRNDSERKRQETIQDARDKLKRERSELFDALAEDIPVSREVPELIPGELVYLPQFRQKGHIVSAPNANGDVVVQVGIMKVTVPAATCQKIAAEEPRKYERSGIAAMAMAKAQKVSTELDLRGMMVDEALEAVEKYLDDALLSGVPRVNIIHGKGTGALRKAVREYLGGHPRVTNYRLGGPGEGGDGATVVDLG
jgi:DNA mismatch repair protein MutS2